MSLHLTLISVDVLFAIGCQSLDSWRRLISVSLGENILRFVLKRIFFRVPEDESIQEPHQREIGEWVSSVFNLLR